MASVYIALGSNLDPAAHLCEAANLLSFLFTVTGVSDFYRTPTLERPDQPEFMNGMVRVETDFPPQAVKREILQNIEEQLGRVRTADKYAARTIDLDICLYGDLLLREPGLTLPDPELTRRPFLFIPVLDIDPDIRFPGTDRKLSELVPARKDVKGLCRDVSLTSTLKEILHGKTHP